MEAPISPTPPSEPHDPDQARAACLAALHRLITPEMLARSLASLPKDAQRRIIGKYLIDRPVRRTIKIITRNRHKKP